MVADLAVDVAPAESLLAHARHDHQEAGEDHRGERRDRRASRDQHHAVILPADRVFRLRHCPERRCGFAAAKIRPATDIRLLVQAYVGDKRGGTT